MTRNVCAVCENPLAIFLKAGVALGNPFAHLGKIQCPPCDFYAEMSILTNQTDMYVLESIASRI